ncbi:hypothetical protein ANAEL_05064 [Anaerolineales bacterium]|nr:hypothetical protein ANAEL_05064 [Anaerolineales bacterium]
MKQQLTLNWLIPLIVILTLVAAGVGLFWMDGSDPHPFTTVHGETVDIYGKGLYSHDTVFSASTTRGTDMVTLFVGLPLLLVSFALYRRGSLRGGLMLSGVLAYFLYYGASLGLDKAYNSLFLVYIALFSACFYAFVIAFTAIDLTQLSSRVSNRLPVRGMAIFMFIVGIGLAFIWLSDIVTALLNDSIPAALGSSTTPVTYTIDVGIIAVACVLAGAQLLRREPSGYLLFAVLSIMLIQVGAMVIGQTIMEMAAGIKLTPGELIGKSASFIVMAGAATWLTAILFKNIFESKGIK